MNPNLEPIPRGLRIVSGCLLAIKVAFLPGVASAGTVETMPPAATAVANQDPTQEPVVLQSGDVESLALASAASSLLGSGLLAAGGKRRRRKRSAVEPDPAEQLTMGDELPPEEH